MEYSKLRDLLKQLCCTNLGQQYVHWRPGPLCLWLITEPLEIIIHSNNRNSNKLSFLSATMCCGQNIRDCVALVKILMQ